MQEMMTSLFRLFFFSFWAVGVTTLRGFFSFPKKISSKNNHPMHIFQYLLYFGMISGLLICCSDAMALSSVLHAKLNDAEPVT